jgi:pimeloyl-ACP methyl ester carboxylesterase
VHAQGKGGVSADPFAFLSTSGDHFQQNISKVGMPTMRPWIGVGLIAFVWLCPVPTPAAPSAAIVFKDLKVADMRLSPSGRYVAAIMALNGSMNLIIIDLADSTKTALTEYPPPGRVLAVHWKSDDTLVYVSSGNVKGFEQHDEWAINRHGKQIINLFHWIPSNNEAEFRGIIDWLPEVTNTVLAAVGGSNLDHHSESYFFHVKRLSVGPGGTTREETIGGGPDCSFVVDHEGNPRACLSTELDLRRGLYYRDTANSPWRKLSMLKYGESEITPLAFTADNKHLFVLSNFGRNARALFELDPESNDLKGPLAGVPEGVFQGVFGNDGRSLIGVRYRIQDREHIYYLEEAMAALQKAMFAAFPARGVAIHSVSDDLARVIVRVDSDQGPGQYYLYESAKHSLERLADRAPWIDPSQFGEQKAVRFAARDGTTLDGYLTLPPDHDAKALPLVLWPSGAPGSHAGAGWNPVAQFFATRGYAVLRVNNRWAGGNGRTDLLDSIEWAVSEGLVAKDRVALYGADLNGYVALMATAKAPDAYRCVISYAGVINLERLFDRVSSSRSLRRERSDAELASWERVLGGHRDAAFLKDESPLYNADKIRGPVFLAYSVDDTLVPYSDAEELKKALERAHKSVVLLGKNQEPHLFDKEQDKIDLFTKLESFLEGCNPSQ